jgi:hypothetical protein
MRWLSVVAAALGLLALIGGWSRPLLVAEAPVRAASAGHAGSGGGEAAIAQPVTEVERARDPAVPPPAPVAPPERAPAPAAVATLELPEVTVVVERGDFEEALPTAPGAATSAPARATRADRSGDLVRRLLGLQEALRE